NYKFIYKVTATDNHPVVFRFIGTVNVPANLTPYNEKTAELGGSKGDNGNLAITKYGKNITIEGIGEDAMIFGWGFTFSQTSTCPKDAGMSFEVRNLTFKNYTEDALGFQGDDGSTCPIQRVWVHNNVFYPGYCANPTESDKSEGDGSCDFKRGQYYTMSYNHYIKCHKTNLLGKGAGDEQFYVSLHHNWYEDVASRQPLGADGNVHIYNTYFQDTGSAKKHNTSQIIDLRGAASVFAENNYFENCKNYYKTRNATSYLKLYNNTTTDDTYPDSSQSGKVILATERSQEGLTNGLVLPNGTSLDNWDTNPAIFYGANTTSSFQLDDTAKVPEVVTTYAGTLKAFPVTESGTITITVKEKENGNAVTDATLTANGLTFKHQGSGVYSATAQLGAEYKIVVSKEGYSNVEITSNVLENDGDTFNANASLEKDYDGYAIVKLIGGENKEAVTGATVTLNDGTVLVDQKDGTYKSAKQIAVGNYTATITNTGDFVAPAGAQAVVVKTTDAAAEITLDKIKGKVKVNIVAAEGETKELNLENIRSSVYVGTTALTRNGNAFEGEVEINTALDIYANISGWNVDSITPSKITAVKDSVAEATVTLKAMGSVYTWNYTTGENTEDFFSLPSSLADWNSAKNNVKEYDGMELNKAVKVDKNFVVTFDAPEAGQIAVVMDAKDGSSLYVNGESVSVTTGINYIDVNAGEVTIKKNKNESHMYLIQYAAGGFGDNPTPPTPVSTTESTTEATTETTTEESTYSIPVTFGEPVHNNGEDSGIKVEYIEAEDLWRLTDTSADKAATLSLPFDAITSGKIVIKGKATPSTAASKWAMVSVIGTTTNTPPNEATVNEAAALATDPNKNITLRTDGNNDNTDAYASSSIAQQAKTYDYKFIIDMDEKTATLFFDGNTFEKAFTADSISSINFITSIKASRNLDVTVPYVGIITDGEASLKDEIMWDVAKKYIVTDNVLPEENGLTFGTSFKTYEEGEGPVDFVDGDNLYKMSVYLQGDANPLAADGKNPANTQSIPVSGTYLKYVPEKDGVFTMAVKTGSDKTTYVTDETGSPIRQIKAGITRYDVVRFNAKVGHTYYIFAGASKMCVYYLGFTSGIEVEDPVAPVEPIKDYEDPDGDTYTTANDAAMLLRAYAAGDTVNITEEFIVNTLKKALGIEE
ncbi:MAG: hypothetical protein IJ736_16170, partial [Firmicutes bacterium]|nr:hypothetical protein [Bacillota bacterium]